MERYLDTAAAAEFLGIHPQTLRKWDRDGIMKPAGRTPTGQRRYTEIQLREALGGVAPELPKKCLCTDAA